MITQHLLMAKFLPLRILQTPANMFERPRSCRKILMMRDRFLVSSQIFFVARQLM